MMRSLTKILFVLAAIAAPLAPSQAAPPRVAVLSAVQDSDAVAWKNAVAVNGGTVSPARLALMSTLVRAYKACGWWGLMDDAAMLVAENAPQALTSLKLRRLMTAVASPTFTTDRGYAFNGTSQYIDTGFVPSTMAVQMSVGNGRLSVYERTNVGTNTAAIGFVTGNSFALRPRNASDQFFGTVFSSGATVQTSVTDSRGLSVLGRAGGGTSVLAWKNGVSQTGATVTPSATSPVNSFYIGAANNGGSGTTFRASTIGYADWGAPLPTTGQELAVYTALQAYMTAVGANV